MVSRRLTRLRRLAVLQAKLRDLEEQRLAELRRREVEIEEAQRAILDALGRETPPTGQFGAVLSRQVGKLAADGVDLEARRTAQAARVAEEGARLRQAERAADTAEREAEREAERQSLDGLVEQFAARKSARLR